MELTLNFLGCPSTSTKIKYDTTGEDTRSCCCAASGAASGAADRLKNERSDANPEHVSKERILEQGIDKRLKREAKKDAAWLGPSRGRNNNSQASPDEVGETESKTPDREAAAEPINAQARDRHGDDNDAEHQIDGQAEEAYRIRTGDNTEQDAAKSDLDEANSQELRSVCDDGAGSGRMMPSPNHLDVTKHPVSDNTIGCLRTETKDQSANDVTSAASESGRSRWQHIPLKISNLSSALLGRAATPRVQRSPQRDSSPYKKQPHNSKGSSAPATGSLGFTSITRAASVSPVRRKGTRTELKRHDLFKRCGTQHDPKEAEKNAEFRHALFARAPSPSTAVPDLQVGERLARPPTTSLGSSDLHRYPSAVYATQSAEASIQNGTCPVILEKKTGWPPWMPYGDIKQNSPQNFLDKHILTTQGEEREKCQDINPSSIKNTALEIGDLSVKPPVFISDLNSDFVRIPYTPTGPDGVVSESFNKKKPGGCANVDTDRPTDAESCPNVQGSAHACSRPRSSRRHPVLDKMFRHVLASLVQESGPPSSARLASVLEQASGRGGSGRTASDSGPSNKSRPLVSQSTATATNSGVRSGSNSSLAGRFSASYIADRCFLFGNSSASRLLASAAQGSELSANNETVCKVNKVNEEAKFSPRKVKEQGKATMATGDAS